MQTQVQMPSSVFCKIFRKIFFFKETLVATSEYRQKQIDKTNLTFTVPIAQP